MTLINDIESKVNILVRNTALTSVFQLPPLKPYSDDVVSFLELLSTTLLKHERGKDYPELVALGFWLRRSNIDAMLNALPKQSEVVRQPLGVVLHFTPANVDTMFIYSWICSLMMGNNNIVRVSRSESVVKELLLSLIDELFSSENFVSIAQRNVFVQYDHNDQITRELSLKCNGRVIWGGDRTIEQIRGIASHPKCRDISFADRYSAAIVNGTELQSPESLTELSAKVWKDSFPYSQMACSSPKILFWLGEQNAINTLFEQLNELAGKNVASVASKNDHLVCSQLLCSVSENNHILFDKAVTAIEIENLNQRLLEWHCGNLYFYVIFLNELQEIQHYLDEKCQTLSYFGVTKEKMVKLIEDQSITGVDRVVPIGQSLDFSAQWDGYDLLEQLSKKIVVKG